MITRILVLIGIALALFAAGFALVVAIQSFHDGIEEKGRVAGDAAGAARVQNLWDKDRAQAQAAAIENARLSAAETLRRLNKQQENQRVQDQLLAQSRRDAAAATAAVDGLRLRASTYLDAAGCGAVTGDSAVECVRKAAAQIGVALGQCAARHQQLAADTDDARARGLKCEADYDALILKPD